MEAPELKSQNKKLSVDYRFLCLFLLLVVIVMLAFWKPWKKESTVTRRVTLTGSATIKAEPDQYQFSPYYERDKLEDVTKLNSELIPKLKELGIADKDIKSNTSTYDNYPVAYGTEKLVPAKKSTLSLTILVKNKDLAQKVQNYLSTTDPKGAVSPNASFSDAKAKSLKADASAAAIKDAKEQAAKRAELLDAKLGKVIEIKDEDQNFGIMPYTKSMEMSAADSPRSSAPLTIQAGENDYPYSVIVTYELQ